jgi:hypothetical protein
MERLAELQAHLEKNRQIKKVWIKDENWVFNEPMTKTKEAEGTGEDRKAAEYKTMDGWKAYTSKEVKAMAVSEVKKPKEVEGGEDPNAAVKAAAKGGNKQ